MTRNTQIGHVFDRSVSVLTRGLAIVSAIATAMLLVTIVADVALRVLVNRPLGGVIELSENWFMIVIVYGALAYAQAKRGHIDVPLVFNRFNPGHRKVLAIIGAVLTCAVVLAIVVWGWGAAMESFSIQESAPASELIIWPSRFIVVIGAALFLLEIIREALRGDLMADAVADDDDSDLTTSTV